jgi:hypothetical protein
MLTSAAKAVSYYVRYGIAEEVAEKLNSCARSKHKG